jgi:hypothetical protein
MLQTTVHLHIGYSMSFLNPNKPPAKTNKKILSSPKKRTKSKSSGLKPKKSNRTITTQSIAIYLKAPPISFMKNNILLSSTLNKNHNL